MRTLDDISSMNKYGTVQKVYKSEDGKDANAEAKALFHGIDESGSVIALGDVRAISGYSLAVQDSKSGLYGLFLYRKRYTHIYRWQARNVTYACFQKYNGRKGTSLFRPRRRLR